MSGCAAKYRGKTSMICSRPVRVTLQRAVAGITQNKNITFLQT